MKIVASMAIATLIALGVSAGDAAAANCGMDFQHAYEKGVRHGRADGGHMKEFSPLRHGMKYMFQFNGRSECYVEGYKIGYENAHADATKRPSRPSHDNAPTPGSNERAYYDDGCHEGTADAKMSMSMAYERHSDMYDRRFEPYFKQGYQHCWKIFR